LLSSTVLLLSILAVLSWLLVLAVIWLFWLFCEALLCDCFCYCNRCFTLHGLSHVCESLGKGCELVCVFQSDAADRNPPSFRITADPARIAVYPNCHCPFNRYHIYLSCLSSC
jgi:hypothetical protein